MIRRLAARRPAAMPARSRTRCQSAKTAPARRAARSASAIVGAAPPTAASRSSLTCTIVEAAVTTAQARVRRVALLASRNAAAAEVTINVRSARARVRRPATPRIERASAMTPNAGPERFASDRAADGSAAATGATPAEPIRRAAALPRVAEIWPTIRPIAAPVARFAPPGSRANRARAHATPTRTAMPAAWAPASRIRRATPVPVAPIAAAAGARCARLVSAVSRATVAADAGPRASRAAPRAPAPETPAAAVRRPCPGGRGAVKQHPRHPGCSRARN